MSIFTDVSCGHVIIEPTGINTLAGTQKMQGGLPPRTQALWRAVAKEFPQATGLGAWGDSSHQARPSCHNTGRALDIMTLDPKLHAEIVKWLLAHRVEFGITLIISRRRKRSAKSKWLPVPYLGKSPHNDHVHVSCDGCNG